jgi:predicted RNA-binding protein associated with RNAse of E/G family
MVTSYVPAVHAVSHLLDSSTPAGRENYTSRMAGNVSGRHRVGDVVALRYVTAGGRIEMCWPCRVVEDGDVVALFIAAGSTYKAGPKRTAAEKRRQSRNALPQTEYVWRNDTLRLMIPERAHSVSMFWERNAGTRRLLKYFVNMEEPFRRTAVGYDTQDHTLDIEVTPDLAWHWRDEEELANHVAEGFYTAELAAAARAEGEQVIGAIERLQHECMRGWLQWTPPPEWRVPGLLDGWDTTPPTVWDRRDWAYGDDRF